MRLWERHRLRVDQVRHAVTRETGSTLARPSVRHRRVAPDCQSARIVIETTIERGRKTASVVFRETIWSRTTTRCWRSATRTLTGGSCGYDEMFMRRELANIVRGEGDADGDPRVTRELQQTAARRSTPEHGS